MPAARAADPRPLDPPSPGGAPRSQGRIRTVTFTEKHGTTRRMQVRPAPPPPAPRAIPICCPSAPARRARSTCAARRASPRTAGSTIARPFTKVDGGPRPPPIRAGNPRRRNRLRPPDRLTGVLRAPSVAVTDR
jgi:hypothetical protein